MAIGSAEFQNALRQREAAQASRAAVPADRPEYPSNTLALNNLLDAHISFLSGKLKVEPKVSLTNLLSQIDAGNLDESSRTKLFSLLKILKAKTDGKDLALTIAAKLQEAYEKNGPSYINKNLLSSIFKFLQEDIKGNDQGAHTEAINIAEHSKTTETTKIYSSLGANTALIKLKEILIPSSLNRHLGTVETEFLARISNASLDANFKDCSSLREQLAQKSLNKHASKLAEIPLIINGTEVLPLTATVGEVRFLTGDSKAKEKELNISKIIRALVEGKDRTERSEAVKDYFLYHAVLNDRATETANNDEKRALYQQRQALQALMTSQRYIGEIKPFFQAAMIEGIAIIAENKTTKLLQNLNKADEIAYVNAANETIRAAGHKSVTSDGSTISQFQTSLEETYMQVDRGISEQAQKILTNYTDFTPRRSDDARAIPAVQFAVSTAKDNLFSDVDFNAAKHDQLADAIANAAPSNRNGDINWVDPAAADYATKLGLDVTTLPDNTGGFREFVRYSADKDSLIHHCRINSKNTTINPLNKSIALAADELHVLNYGGPRSALQEVLSGGIISRIYKEADFRDLATLITDDDRKRATIQRQLNAYPGNSAEAISGLKDLITHLCFNSNQTEQEVATSIDSRLNITEGSGFVDVNIKPELEIADKVQSLYKDLNTNTSDRYTDARSWLRETVNGDLCSAKRHQGQAETQTHLDFILGLEHHHYPQIKIVGLSKIIKALIGERDVAKKNLVKEYLEEQLGIRFKHDVLENSGTPISRSDLGEIFTTQMNEMHYIDKHMEAFSQASRKVDRLAGASLASIYLPIFQDSPTNLQTLVSQLQLIRDHLASSQNTNDVVRFARSQKMPEALVDFCERLAGTYHDHTNPYSVESASTKEVCKIVDAFTTTVVQRMAA